VNCFKNKTRIAHIKDLAWDIALRFLKEENLENSLFSEDIGESFFEEIMKIKEISKFQWEYDSNGTHSLLKDHFLINFFRSIKIFSRRENIENNFEDSEELNTFFLEQFEKLENEILFSENFEYEILIPTFRVIFPPKINRIKFDTNHCLRNIKDEEFPYGESHPLDKFKEIPLSWSRRWNRKPDASFELEFLILKRSHKESPYEENFTPIAPFNLSYYISPINEKVKSIYDFFLCNNLKFYPPPFTFGDIYYVKLPPFSQMYEYFTNYTLNEFPLPAGILSLKNSKDLSYWRKKWKDHYQKFYESYYSFLEIKEDIRILKYVFNVLRTIHKIQYPKVKNFLLVSSLEGLLFYKKINKKLGIKETYKKEPVALTFAAICEDQIEWWQYIFQIKYTLKNPLTSFKNKGDIIDLIKSAFNYRNNIAHPEKHKKIHIKPKYLHGKNFLGGEEDTLESIITREFPNFLLFLIKVWIDKGFKSVDQWRDYLINLFP